VRCSDASRSPAPQRRLPATIDGRRGVHRHYLRLRGPIQNPSRPKGGDCRCTLQSVDHQLPARARPMVSVPHRVPARRFSNPARVPSPDVAPVIIVPNQTVRASTMPLPSVQYLGSEREIPCALALALRRALRHGRPWHPPSTSPHFPWPSRCLVFAHPRRPSLLLAARWLHHHRRTALPKTAHPRITLGINFPCVRADEMNDEDGPANPPPSIRPTKSREASKLNQP
jgi:hypothetical protein